MFQRQSVNVCVVCDCVKQNQDSINMDTVCRLYEVGRQRLAEEEEDEEDQVRHTYFFQNIGGFVRCLVLKTFGEKIPNPLKSHQIRTLCD